MTFLSPAFLLLAAAAAIPLLVHLLRRRMEQRIDFPAARYLERAERENSRKLRLRNLLLMLLRVLAIALIAAAAARPVGRLAGTGHAPTAVAIVLDNSLSTSVIRDGRPMLEQLKEAARAAIAAGTPADQFWLITADSRVAGGNAAAMSDALDRTRSLAGGGDLRAAIARAGALVGGSALAERRLAILTDGQPSSWSGVAETGLDDVSVLLLAPPAVETPNRAVVLADARPTRWTPRGEVVARVASPDSASYRVMVGERTLARGNVSPNEEIVVRAAPAERGWHAGSVELEPDELRGDDIRYFAISIGAPPGVRIGAGVGPFVSSAIDALAQSGRVAIGSQLSITTGDGLETLPALIVPPSDPVRVGAANRALERAGVPWRFGPTRRGPGRARSPHDASWDSAQVIIHARYALEPTRAAPMDTLATVDGEPWIVAGEGFVLIGSALEPGATSLPIRAAFIPWLGDVLTQRLTGGERTAARPGERVRRPVWADALEAPDGQRIPIAGSTIEAPERSGVYFLLRGPDRSGALVVNGEPEESALGRLDDSALRERVRGGEVAVASDARLWARSLFATADGQPLAVPFLVAALVALLAESAVAGAGGRRGT